MRRALAAALALAAAPATAQTLPYEGTWAMRAEWCRPAPAGSDRPAPLVITARRMTAGPMVCDFSSVLPGGVGYRIEATCVDGQEKAQLFLLLSKIGDSLHVSMEGRTESFVGCR